MSFMCVSISFAATNKPSQVKNLKATTTTSTVKLTWTKINGAKYTVYSYNPSNKSYTAIAGVSSNTYTVKNLNQGTTYRYAVKAYTTKNGNKTYGKMSSVVKATTKVTSPSQVKNLKATATTNTIKLTWTKISGVKYTVYSYNERNGTYKFISNVSKNTYTVKSLSENQTYSYAVRAYKTVNNKNHYGAYSSIVKVTTKTPTLTLHKASTLYEESIDIYMNWVYSCKYISAKETIKHPLYGMNCTFARVVHDSVKTLDDLKALLSKYFDKSVYENELYLYVEVNSKLYYYAEGGSSETDKGVQYYTNSLTKLSNTEYEYTLKPKYYSSYTGPKKSSYTYTIIRKDGKWVFTNKFYPCCRTVKS